MKRIKTYICLLFVALTAIQCSDKLKDEVLTVYDKQPIGTFLESRQDFSEWVKLLKYTGFFSALNVKDKYTCFVPTNEAVQAYLQEKEYSSVESIPLETARYIVRYSMISAPQNYYSSAFGNGKLQDSTASGDYLITKFRTGGVNAIYVNDYARIISKDVEVINGVIHVVDKVLDPVLRTVKDIVGAEPSYSIFSEALRLSGLGAELERIYADGRKAYHTLLVVSDETFAAAQIHDIAGLIRELGAGESGYTDSANPLYRYVAYHCVGGNYAVSDLAEFPESTASKNITTMASGELFSISDVKGKLYLNKDKEDLQTARFCEERTDMQARNGFVHEVDRIMKVWSPEPSTVLFEFSDYAEFRAVPFFRVYKPGVNNQKQYFTREDAPQEIRWMTIPDGNAQLWYENRQTWTSLRYNDAVGIDVGAVGWIEFDLPIVVRGKYKVSLSCNKYNGRGTFQPIFDGVRLGGIINFNGAAGVYELGKVDFKVTSTHVIRFSVVKTGYAEIDYILFEPIK